MILLRRRLNEMTFRVIEAEMQAVLDLVNDVADSAMSVARRQIVAELGAGADIPVPTFKRFQDSILADVRRNYKDYWYSARTPADRARLELRLSLSVSTLARQAYTDQMLAAYRTRPGKVMKQWRASFTGNTPCPVCLELHGTSVPIDEEFYFSGSKRHPVYDDLLGPPRHPRCKCYLVFYTDTPPDEVKTSEAPRVWDTDFVKSLPKKRFRAILNKLKKLFSGVKRTR